MPPSSSSSSSSTPPPSRAFGSPLAAPERKNQLALVSLLLGLLALALAYEAITHNLLGIFGLVAGLTAVGAVISGHIALAQAYRYPRGQTRRGLAIGGLALGYIALASLVATIVLLFVAFFSLE